ncbi:MAG: DUF4160 domain-containing protein [Candidatus Devosia phytovorans]|uniref:DUF4160 domain-containing protein n=1 Tax=Candidatus Devosia phytovorans TaxID=3121372 RepID=A0AAJ5VQ78_9HYPH|nr:DUF4160 domain-containing protein [Devosia sp.]WEK02728.1 MAG: DUF4160 domain-containing protein [Devosia sp.]
MITVLQSGGMRFVIYQNDHQPAHVHVYGDGDARIDIVEVSLLSHRGMSKRDLSRAKAVVFEHRSMLLAKWEEIHVTARNH